jgi:Glu-tRNA(Gln) amidotransferase subunit E-like FAD-binding protein
MECEYDEEEKVFCKCPVEEREQKSRLREG